MGLTNYMPQRNDLKSSQHFGKYFHEGGLQDKTWVKNADAVHTLLQCYFYEEFNFQVWNISGSVWRW